MDVEAQFRLQRTGWWLGMNPVAPALLEGEQSHGRGVSRPSSESGSAGQTLHLLSRLLCATLPRAENTDLNMADVDCALLGCPLCLTMTPGSSHLSLSLPISKMRRVDRDF